MRPTETIETFQLKTKARYLRILQVLISSLHDQNKSGFCGGPDFIQQSIRAI